MEEILRLLDILEVNNESIILTNLNLGESS